MADHTVEFRDNQDVEFHLMGFDKKTLADTMNELVEDGDSRVVFLLGMHEMIVATQGLLCSLQSDEDKATIGAIRDDLTELWDGVKAKPLPLPMNEIESLYARLCEFKQEAKARGMTRSGAV